MIKFTTLLHFTFLFVFIFLPNLVLSECTCDHEEEEEKNKTKALRYKIAAIASILAAGAIGVCLPILGKTIPALRPEKNIFFIIKAFAAGVILSTGFIHVLPDAFERLTSPCLNENPWGKFPFTGFVAMVAAIGTLMIDASATAYFSKSSFAKAQSENRVEEASVHTHATHGHSHGPVVNSVETELLRQRVVAQVTNFQFQIFYG